MSESIIAKWVLFVLGVMTAVFGLAGYSFDKFETREHALEMRSGIERRLDRIEEKIDRLIQGK